MEEKRGNWKSSLGFILAAAGSAVGLGNIWRFPYLMGTNGGLWFLIIYLIIVVLLGVPVMLGELTIGRFTQQSPVGAYEKIRKGWGFVGVLAILAPFLIMTYYQIVGGWALNYMFSYLSVGTGVDFGTLIGGGMPLGVWQPVLWTIIFMAATWLVCVNGASGIEKASKIMMPTLFVLLIIVIIRSVTLPGAGAGLAFIFANTGGFTLGAIPAACGQVFFSLSIGMGAMITYGSYLSKNERLPNSTLKIAIMDTSVAILASIAIFPAVFAMGGEPSAGAGLVFITLPGIFEAMPFGIIIAALFFLLIFFAAITSAISLVEACSSFMVDSWGWEKKKSVNVLCAVMTVLSIPNSLSNASDTIFSGGNVLGTGMNLFDTVDFIANNVLLPVGGLLMCILIGWLWKPENAIKEMENTPNYKFKLAVAWKRCIQFVTPILIIIVLVVQVQQIIAMYTA